MSLGRSWADDDDDCDLPSPPPPAPQTEPSPKIIRSYATAIVEKPPVVLPPPRVVLVSTTTVRFSSHSTGEFREKKPRKQREERILRVSASEPVIDRRTSIVIRKPRISETVCENCKIEDGKYEFTQDHVDHQSKDGTVQLTVGKYCLACVTASAPRCDNKECTGRALINRPGSRWPFKMHCATCVTNHNAK